MRLLRGAGHPLGASLRLSASVEMHIDNNDDADDADDDDNIIKNIDINNNSNTNNINKNRSCY